MVNILFLAFLDLILLFLITLIFLNSILNFLDNKCNNVKKFIFKHENFVVGLFLFLFFFEQLLLVFLAFYFKNNTNLLHLIISLFALIVITTSSSQKLLLEMKNMYLKTELRIIGKQNLTYLEEIKQLINENESLKEKSNKKK